MKISWNIEIQIMKKNYKNELKDGVIFCNLLAFVLHKTKTYLSFRPNPLKIGIKATQL